MQYAYFFYLQDDTRFGTIQNMAFDWQVVYDVTCRRRFGRVRVRAWAAYAPTCDCGMDREVATTRVTLDGMRGRAILFGRCTKVLASCLCPYAIDCS